MLAFCRSMSIGIRQSWVSGFVEVFKSFLCMKHLTTLYDIVCIFILRRYRTPLLKKTSLPWAVLLLRQKLLLMPWHDAFVPIFKTWYGLYNICVRYTLVLVWYVDFVWFCVSLRHIIYEHCWAILEAGWMNFCYTYTHAITKMLQNQNPGFSQKTRNYFWCPIVLW
jgi:hypothetical protein